jgi:hypothetical protein
MYSPARHRVLLRRTQHAMGALLLLYLALVLERERTMGQQEIFPFASWSLFTLVPNERNDYSIRLLRVNGQALSPARYYEDCGKIFPSASGNASWMALQELGRAQVRGDAIGVAEVRRYFEPLHLSGAGAVEYELVSRRWDPMERWRHGLFREQRVLKRFFTNDAGAR